MAIPGPTVILTLSAGRYCLNLMKFSLSFTNLCTFALAAALFCGGCASTESSKQASSSEAHNDGDTTVKLKKDKDLQGIWLKPGFSFSGRPVLSIEPTVYKGVERPNEVAMRAFAVKELREQVA